MVLSTTRYSCPVIPPISIEYTSKSTQSLTVGNFLWESISSLAVSFILTAFQMNAFSELLDLIFRVTEDVSRANLENEAKEKDEKIKELEAKVSDLEHQVMVAKGEK